MDERGSGRGGGDPLIGQIVANYRVVGRIGQGGMGAVYLAQHTVLGRNAAVKVLLPEFSHNRDLVGRFLNEARATAQLRYRGFVEIFDSGMLRDGSAYLVMEYLRGVNLAAAIDWRRTLAAGETLAILREVAGAVAQAHAQGIVHRDLKPDNVFLAVNAEDPIGRAGATIKVLDFGIAKLSGPSNAGAPSARTRTGSLLGTPLYMSPEQCRGAGYVDHRTDIYSLGCVAYHALTGRPPFALEGFGEIISAHLSQAPRPPRTIVPGLSEAVEAFVLRLLEKDPASRPQTMDAVAAALDQLRVTEGGGTAPELGALIPPAALAQPAFPPLPSRPGVVATTPFPEGGHSPTPPPPARSAAQSGNTHRVEGGTEGGGGSGVRGPASISTLAGAASELRDEDRSVQLRPRLGRGLGIALGVGGGVAVAVALVLAFGGSGSHADRQSGRGPRRVVPLDLEQHPPVQPLPPDDNAAQPSSSSPSSSSSSGTPPARVPDTDPVPDRPPGPPATGATVTIKLGSVPAGAWVVDAKTNRVVGETPFEAAVPRRDGELGFIVRKRGYYPKRVSIEASRNNESTVTLDRREDLAPSAPDEGNDDRRKL